MDNYTSYVYFWDECFTFSLPFVLLVLDVFMSQI